MSDALLDELDTAIGLIEAKSKKLWGHGHGLELEIALLKDVKKRLSAVPKASVKKTFFSRHEADSSPD